ncbi:CDP-alcohol phosphatidyltransferase family protein [Variovorax paradoxus]|nr:CDP-alcohol phosphatidyltransferase family protein [Variovorax paradoxus]
MITHPPADRPAFSAGRLAALRRDAWREAVPCFLLLAVAAGAVTLLGELSPWFKLKAAAVFAATFAWVLHGLPAHAPNARFGPANRVTLARLALIALIAACVGEPLADAHTMAWGVILVGTTAALLDAVDGPLARRGGLASEFGARFDMEADALTVLVLCLLVFHFDKAGAWVLAAGLMRYAFVLAMRPWPWMARPLPPSQRRKAVCVAQITSLLVCLGPIITLPWSRALAAASLAALSASFAVDIAWLARHRASPPESAS